MSNPEVSLISRGKSFIVTIDGKEIPTTKCMIVKQEGSVAEVILHIPSDVVVAKLESQCTIIQDNKPRSL